MRRLIAPLAALVLGSGLALAMAPGAQAAPASPHHSHCDLVYTVSPSFYREDNTSFDGGVPTVSLGTDPIALTFNVALVDSHTGATCGDPLKGWELWAGNAVSGSGDSDSRNLYAHVTQGSPIYTVNPAGLQNSDAGDLFNVKFYAWTASHYYSTVDASLDVKRATEWTGFNAFPEPVEQGDTIHQHGTLLRANWEFNTWQGYADRKVDSESHTLGGPYQVDHLPAFHTSSTGYAAAAVRADTTRVHRFAYFGNSVAGASRAGGDKVLVNN